MASIHQRRGSKYIHGCIRLPTGKRKYFSTKETEPAKARAIVESMERALQREKVEERAVDRVRAMMNEIYGEKSVAIDWLDAHAKSRKAEVGDSHHKKVLQAVGELKALCEERGYTRLSEISSQTIKGLRSSYLQRKKPLSPSTANLRIQTIKAVFQSAHLEQVITHNPCVGIKPLKTVTTEKGIFPDSDIRKLHGAVDYESDWMGVMLFGEWTGQRLGDFASMDWEDLILAESLWPMTTQKTGKNLRMPLRSEITKWLWARADGKTLTGPVFPTLQGAKNGKLSNQFAAVMERAKIDRGIVDRGTARTFSKKSFHSFRHTLTTRLKAAGVSGEVAMAVIGHDSKAVSKRYTHLEGEVLGALSGLTG